MDDLRNKAARKLNEVLRGLIVGDSVFPLPIRIAKPKTTAPLSEWRAIDSLIRSQSRESLGFGYTIEWATVNSKRHGKNEFPVRLSFASADDFLKYLGAEHEAQAVLANVTRLCEWAPSARTWCAEHLPLMRKPAETIQYAIKLLTYLQANPAPGLYPRQLPVAVPTKFFEQERPLLSALVQAFAPECRVQTEGTLEEQLGLMSKESLIEFRSLDPTIESLPFGHAMATARELAEKAHYFEAFERVIVVENHVPFLTLPHLPKTIAIMGHGFAVSRLGRVGWLAAKHVYYWGDIDLSGFGILAQIRAALPTVESILMDAETFERCRAYQQPHSAEQQVSEAQQIYLTAAESAMVRQLQALSGIRVEQEQIDYTMVQETLRRRIAPEALTPT
ncbi:DUF2220 family protein [Coraliomargarita algicola]|uniref:DUF2220 family protein n=1 Tax=Coraliomargarita algicola TaxID=3092156 RepID=A0ABZ0RDV1_9BACT|nr:Wadjet anti-phage system protein JetD domain-containing protein [Coraliomargarita sp. J2-16]WPJ94335.1 DUF2220 family protein [Coraliomargarita sp. J2-16]